MLIDSHSSNWRETFTATFKQLFGMVGQAHAGIRFLDHSRGPIIRVNNAYTDHVRAALVCMPALAACKQVSGTVKGVNGGK